MASFVLLVVLCLLFVVTTLVKTTLAILLGALPFCNIGVIFHISDVTFVLPHCCQVFLITAFDIVACMTFLRLGNMLGEAFLPNPSGVTATFQTFQFRIEVALVFAWRPNLGSGVRFGEAANPGPSSRKALPSFVKFCITNPTSIAKKEDTYVSLCQQNSCHVISMSETAATAAMQVTFESNVRKHKMNCQWSVPVQPFRETITSHEAAKGKANGTGIISTIPFRPARLPLPSTWNANPRIVHSVITFGQSHIQIIVLYCKPLSHPEAVDFNNELMRVAYDQSLHLPLPLIIMGDFNMPVVDFELWPELADKGFDHLCSIYHKKYQTVMPPSCKEVTNPDSAIVAPSLLPFLREIEVLESTWFATHRPVTFTLQPPDQGLFRQIFRYPKQIVQLGIEHLEEAANDSRNWRCKPNTIEEIGVMFEEVADHALYLQSQQDSTRGLRTLSSAYRGRCQPQQPKQKPIHAAIRHARNGDYEPSCEVLTMKTRQKVKQLRRIQSFCLRLKKYENGIDIKPSTFHELSLEWAAICKCHAFDAKPFLHWTQSIPELGIPLWPLPSHQWTFDLSQIVHYDVEASLRKNAKWYHEKLIYARRIDASKEGHSKQAFRYVRGPSNPPVTEIQHTIEKDFLVVPLDELGHFEIYGDKIDDFDKNFPVLVQGEIFRICHMDIHCMHISSHTIRELPEQVVVKQTTFAHSPQQIAFSLNQFWNPIWQRDESNISEVFAHANFQEIVDTFPPHPAYHIDFDLSFWLEAVKKLKSHSARGIDMISAQELKMVSSDMLQDIANVLTSYTSGFPQWFMIGLTCPLAKTKDIPTHGQTRPITILAQLYRLWSAVSSRHLLRILADWAPPSITGLLPKRGAFDNAYQMQLELELAQAQNQSRSGLTLDLKKCFNCIRWTFAYAMLRALGIPEPLLIQWFLSLTRLCRFWILSGEAWVAGSTTCGFPEGDTFSVVTMIAVSCAWIFYITSQFSHMTLPALSAYADNWGWRLNEINHHCIILRETLWFLEHAGLSIDWDKTWFWTTSNHEASFLASQLNDIAKTAVVRKHSAGDLGLQLQYSGQRVKGLAKNRIDNGCKRLARLQTMQHDLSQKEYLLRASIFPAMFHGCELSIPSSDDLARLRSKVFNALLGKSHSASPVIALALTKNLILDPEPWIWLKVLLTAKKYLHKADSETQYWFFRIASSFRGHMHAIKGPATVFGYVLKQLSWTIDHEGNLSLDTFLRFPLMQISHRRLIRFVNQAWMKSLIEMYTQRHSLFGFRDINRPDTVAVLSKFTCVQRKKLLREISCCFQLPDQQQHWSSETKTTCPFCPAEDSKVHRLLECPIGNEIRENYSELVDDLIATESSLPIFTVLHVNHDSELLDLAQYQHGYGVFNAAVQKMIVDFQVRSLPINWYTDGSCQYPHLVTCRYASYSIIFDACQSDEERVAMASLYRSSKLIPPTLLVACANRVFGEQDILRAELLAIANIIRHFGIGCIYTDSATAIHYFNRFLGADRISQISDLEHFDIFARLWPLKEDLQVCFAKIKAHTDLSQVANNELYQFLGNQVADDTAVESCHKLLPDFAKHLKKRAEQTLIDRERLHQVYTMQLQLFDLRSKTLRQQQCFSQGTRVHAQPEIVDAFLQWYIEEPVKFSGPWDTTELQSCAWGVDNATRTLDWLQQIQWPNHSLGPMGQSTGITWAEMALSWMFYNKRFLPLRRKDQFGIERVVQAGTFADAKEWGASLSEFGSNCQHLLEHVQSLVVQQIMPKLATGKCSSCYILGFKKFYQGIKMRPVVPFQSELITLLQNELAKGPSKFLDIVPNIPSTTGNSIDSEAYQELYRRSSLAMKRVRKKRKTVGL